MPTVIPVKFSYIARDLWFDPAGTGAQEGDHVICTTERGREIGLATADAREVTPEQAEISRLRAELARSRQECALLKKFAAYLSTTGLK